VAATKHIESQLPHVQEHFAQHLAAVALLSETEPLQTDWLTRFIADAANGLRAQWADAVRVGLRANTTELAIQRWNSWIKPYWQRRLQSIPTSLAPTEAAAMAAWAPHLGQAFPAAVDLAVQTPATLSPRNLLVHSLMESRAAECYPTQAAQLVTHLLSHSQPAIEPEYQLEEFVRTLQPHLEPTILEALVEAAIRAGYQQAATWTGQAQ
jgi:hypothetical protein